MSLLDIKWKGGLMIFCKNDEVTVRSLECNDK